MLFKQLYENNKIRRLTQGKKDCVTVKRENVDKSKWLILCNLKEAYKTCIQR